LSTEADPLEDDMAAEYERRRRLHLGAPADVSAVPPNTTERDGLSDRTSAPSLEPVLSSPPTANTSGTGRDAYVPREIRRKYNVAAFLTTLLWSGPNKAWPGFLAAVPILLWRLDVLPEGVAAIPGLMISIWAGMHGNEWAWRYRRWDSVERFLRVQRRWAWASVAFTVLVVILIAIGYASMPGSSPEEAAVIPAPDPVELAYSNPSEGFSLNYPSDWTKEEPKGTIVALKAPADDLFDDSVEGIVVVAQHVGPRMTLDRFESSLVKALKSDLTEFSDVDLLSSERVTLDERLAYEDHFTGQVASSQSEGSPVEVLSIASLAGGRGYWIAFIAEPGEGFNSWLPTARGIIDSIAIDEEQI
jgi:hypothetical protein